MCGFSSLATEDEKSSVLGPKRRNERDRFSSSRRESASLLLGLV